MKTFLSIATLFALPFLVSADDQEKAKTNAEKLQEVITTSQEASLAGKPSVRNMSLAEFQGLGVEVLLLGAHTSYNAVDKTIELNIDVAPQSLAALKRTVNDGVITLNGFQPGAMRQIASKNPEYFYNTQNTIVSFVKGNNTFSAFNASTDGVPQAYNVGGTTLVKEIVLSMKNNKLNIDITSSDAKIAKGFGNYIAAGIVKGEIRVTDSSARLVFTIVSKLDPKDITVAAASALNQDILYNVKEGRAETAALAKDIKSEFKSTKGLIKSEHKATRADVRVALKENNSILWDGIQDVGNQSEASVTDTWEEVVAE